MAQLIVIISGVLSQYLLTHELETVKYGLLIIIIDFALTISIVIDFGIPTWAVRNWNGKDDYLRDLIIKIFMTQAKLMILIIILSSILIFSIFEPKYFYIYFLILLGTSIITINEPIRVGLRLLDRTEFEAISRSSERVFILLGYFYFSNNYGLNINTASFVILIASFVNFLITIILFMIATKNKNNYKNKNFPNSIHIIKNSIPFCLAVAVYPLLGRVDKFVLAIYDNLEIVATYNVAWVILSTGFIVPSIIRQSILPILAENKENDKFFKIIDKTKKTIYFLILIGVPFSIIISNFLLDIIYPKEYLKTGVFPNYGGIDLFCLLLPSWVWSMLASTTFESLKFHKNPWFFPLVIISSVIINAIIAIYLVEGYGIMGVCIGSIVSQFVIFIFVNIINIKQLDNNQFVIESVIGVGMSIFLVSLGALGINDFAQGKMNPIFIVILLLCYGLLFNRIYVSKNII